MIELRLRSAGADGRYDLKTKRYICAGILTAAAVGLGVCAWKPMRAEATGAAIKSVEESLNQHQTQLGTLTTQISSMQDQQDLLQEEIDDLNSQIINTMTSIGLKQDEIAAKEAEIEEKKAQIQVTKAEYAAAVEQEEKQRENMAAYARLMYEQGGKSYLGALLEGKSIADILNRMGYIERVYQYANDMLEAYITAKDNVQALWNRLEEEEASLEEDMSQLEADYQELESKQENLNLLLEEKQKASADFEAEIEKAKKVAEEAKKVIQQEQAKLKDLKAQYAREQAAAAAASANYATSGYSSVIDNAPGSELGKQIARYACQFIGNRYVYGGTSLTNGTDCSGFTGSVYAHFGYQLHRVADDQRGDGREVSYSEVQPGDILCYGGHVGIYIGGGLMVHASNSQPYPRGGIKVTNAQYKAILNVRRIID